MTCRRAHRLLAAYRRDDWAPRDRAALGQHLSACPACRKIEFAYRSVGESVRQLPSITPPPGFREAVFAAIRADEQRMGRAATVAALTEADTSPELPIITSEQRPISLADAVARKRRIPRLNPRIALAAAAAVIMLGILSIQVLPHSGLASLATSLGAAHSGNGQTAKPSVARYMPDARAHAITRALATTKWLVYSASDTAGATTLYAENRQTKAIAPLTHGSADAPVMLRAVTNDWVFWSAGGASSWTLYAGRPGGGADNAIALAKSDTAADAPATLNGVWANAHMALVAITTSAGGSEVLQFALPATNAAPVTIAETAVQGHALADPSADDSTVFWAERWQDTTGQHSLIWSRNASGQPRQMSADDSAFAPHIANGLLIWVEGQPGTLEAATLSGSRQQWTIAQSVDSESVRVAGEMVLWRAGGAMHAWDTRTHQSSAIDALVRSAAWVEACDSSIVWAGSDGALDVYDVV
ncbi:MAG TPA: zf-HC2 domain-containing protein [Ktedonobacterales bacterium]|nr:zf-HC2 domain-containing protein [Ktedonobacterales bacterium]